MQEEQKRLNPFVNGMTPKVAQQQRDKYVNFIKMLLNNRQYITDIHFWSVSDESVCSSAIGLHYAVDNGDNITHRP
jgi:hypothetical protein